MDRGKAASAENSDYIEPGQSAEADLFRPADAEGVARLFRTVYGAGYPIKTFTHPALLIEENAAARTISSVARTPKGDIVGHNALYQSAPHKRIYESGAGLIHPSYRGVKGIFRRLTVHGQEIDVRDFRVEAIFGEAVCNHPVSQKVSATQGYITQAREIDLMPAAGRPNWEGIQLYGERAKRLLVMVKEDWAKVNKI